MFQNLNQYYDLQIILVGKNSEIIGRTITRGLYYEQRMEIMLFAPFALTFLKHQLSLSMHGPVHFIEKNINFESFFCMELNERTV